MKVLCFLDLQEVTVVVEAWDHEIEDDPHSKFVSLHDEQQVAPLWNVMSSSIQPYCNPVPPILEGV